MEKQSITKAGKSPYQTPSQRVISFGTAGSVLQTSVGLPPMNEEDLGWGDPLLNNNFGSL